MEQNQNPYQPQYPQMQQGYNQPAAGQEQQVNQASEPPYAAGMAQNAPYQQPVQGQWQGSPDMNYQQPYGQGMPQQHGQQQAYPQQPYAPQGYAQAYAGQYGYAPRKRINPAAIILPIVAVVVIVGIILLIVFLSGGGSRSITSYNSSNPFSISVVDSSGNNVEKYISVKTGDKKEIAEAILTYLDRQGNLSYYGMDIDNVNRSIDFIVGQPVSMEYDSDDVKGNIYITCEFPKSLIRSNRHYPDSYMFDGMSRFDVITAVYRGGKWKVDDNNDYSEEEWGDTEISFGWKGAEDKYLVVVDGDALFYALGYDP